MPPKKTKKKPSVSRAKKVELKSEAPQMIEEKPAMSDSATVLKRLSQQFNLLAILVVALFLFQGYIFYKLKNVQSSGSTAGAPAESPLSVEKLVSYAGDLKLNKKEFQKCLDSGDKASVVTADATYGGELGVQGTPGFFINGRFLGGAFPFEAFKEIIDKELDGTATGSCSDYSETIQEYCKDEQNQAFKPEAVAVEVGNSPVRGPKDAKVTIVEFSDFECPFCARAYATVKQIEKEYAKDVKIVYKHYPLSNIHPNAQKAAEASVCAQDQGKFWEMHDKLFEVQS